MQPFFLLGDQGQRFCIHHAATGARCRGAIIYLHPFAEELNKSRRMAAMQARHMASAGFDVLLIDLQGCGDSAGDFSDASWVAWESDVLLACKWLRERTKAPLILWGLRAGCLLASSVAPRLPEQASFVFWNPVLSGKLHWNQFMRLKLAATLVSGQGKGGTEPLKEQLAAGEPVEIAGYSVSAALVDGLQRAELKPPAGGSGRVAWFDISNRDDNVILPAAQRCLELWESSAYSVHYAPVRGPAFWQTTEIEDVPELIDSTLAVLDSWQ